MIILREHAKNTKQKQIPSRSSRVENRCSKISAALELNMGGVHRGSKGSISVDFQAISKAWCKICTRVTQDKSTTPHHQVHESADFWRTRRNATFGDNLRMDQSLRKPTRIRRTQDILHVAYPYQISDPALNSGSRDPASLLIRNHVRMDRRLCIVLREGS